MEGLSNHWLNFDIGYHPSVAWRDYNSESLIPFHYGSNVANWPDVIKFFENAVSSTVTTYGDNFNAPPLTSHSFQTSFAVPSVTTIGMFSMFCMSVCSSFCLFVLNVSFYVPSFLFCCMSCSRACARSSIFRCLVIATPCSCLNLRRRRRNLKESQATSKPPPPLTEHPSSTVSNRFADFSGCVDDNSVSSPTSLAAVGVAGVVVQGTVRWPLFSLFPSFSNPSFL